MASLRWPLLFVLLCFQAVQTQASSWTATVPSSVKGLLGSCVVIPCTFDYPDPGKTLTGMSGMWTNEANQVITHPVNSKVIQEYRDRTELLGDVRQKNCSLMIDRIKRSDQGPFHFRIEMVDYEKYSYRDNSVSIAISEPDPVSFFVNNELKEGETVSASCSVSHSCPASPPVFTWSHSGEKILQEQQLDAGQWKATSTLTFNPTRADHEMTLKCSVRYKGGKHTTASKVLNVAYAPVNVKVEYKSEVKEGESVQLKCSSVANPPASSYEWQNESGAQLFHGKVYMLHNVSRRTGAVYCTAINTIARSKSSPVQLNVLHAPEIKNSSSCSAEADMVKCVCIAESRPPSMVHFVLSDKVLPKAKVEKHGVITMSTLQVEFGSSGFVRCLANNTQGSANLTLSFPVNSKMQNIYMSIAIGAGAILVILLIALGVKNWGRSKDVATTPMSTMKADKDVEHPKYATSMRSAFREQKTYDDADDANEHVYGNMEVDDAIYANV